MNKTTNTKNEHQFWEEQNNKNEHEQQPQSTSFWEEQDSKNEDQHSKFQHEQQPTQQNSNTEKETTYHVNLENHGVFGQFLRSWKWDVSDVNNKYKNFDVV